jgi:hypothetical protein
MAPPVAMSAHFTKGENKKVGMTNLELATNKRKFGREQGILAAAYNRHKP